MNYQVCISCGAQGFKKLFDYNKKYEIVQCKVCDLEFSTYDFTEEEINHFYQSEYFSSPEGYVDYYSDEVLKEKIFEERLKILKTQKETGTLLEIGCAGGIFLNIAYKNGYEVFGIDISEKIIRTAREKYINLKDLMLACKFENFLSKNKFDIIIAMDVIEHIQNPIGFVQKLKEHLTKEGVLLIETPDTETFLKRLFRKNWPMYRPPEHLFYFNRYNLKMILEKNGFSEVLSQKGYKNYTLNYLSEKLKTTNHFLFRVLRLLPEKLKRMEFRISSQSFISLYKKMKD